MKINELLENNSTKIHFIGIGGVSMSALAKLLLHDGHKISGSDFNLSNNVLELEKLGVKIFPSHKKENISNEYNLVVYTAAISKENEELLEARNKNIPCIERCVLLGEMMKVYKFPLNVSGTHGKTTTTSMLSSIFLSANLNPTISVGGDFNRISGNLNIGEKDYFICEACEYVESFLKFYPYASIILNIEADHLDYFSGIEQIKEAFLKFANKADKEGFIVINGDCENCIDIIPKINIKTYTFGLLETNYCYAKNISYNSQGFPSFDVYIKGEFIDRFSLSVVGEHNILNSLACILTSMLFDISIPKIKDGLLEFRGTKRRFEYIGMINDAHVYDDYAHHPTEIQATLNAIKEKKFENLYVVFQPHTFTRTKALLDDFVSVFSDIENLIIADIYAAREKNIYGISSKDLSDKLPYATYKSDFEDIISFLKGKASKDDLIITIGAGDIFKVSHSLCE